MVAVDSVKSQRARTPQTVIRVLQESTPQAVSYWVNDYVAGNHRSKRYAHRHHHNMPGLLVLICMSTYGDDTSNQCTIYVIWPYNMLYGQITWPCFMVNWTRCTDHTICSMDHSTRCMTWSRINWPSNALYSHCTIRWFRTNKCNTLFCGVDGNLFASARAFAHSRVVSTAMDPGRIGEPAEETLVCTASSVQAGGTVLCPQVWLLFSNTFVIHGVTQSYRCNTNDNYTSSYHQTRVLGFHGNFILIPWTFAVTEQFCMSLCNQFVSTRMSRPDIEVCIVVIAHQSEHSSVSVVGWTTLIFNNIDFVQ